MRFVSRIDGRTDSGMTLIAALVGLAVAGIAATAMATMFKNSHSAQRHLELRGELASVRQQIVAGLNCDRTVLAQAACAGGDYIDLRMADSSSGNPRYLMRAGKTLRGAATQGAFANSGQIAGPWYVEARCGATSLEILVARKRKTGWTFVSDPATGKTHDFGANPMRLFGDGEGDMKICQHLFGGPGERLLTVKGPAVLAANQTIADAQTSGIGTAAQPRCGGLDSYAGSPSVVTTAPTFWGPAGTRVANTRHWATAVRCPAGYTAIHGALVDMSLGGAAPASGVSQEGRRDASDPRRWIGVHCMYTRFADEGSGYPAGTSVSDAYEVTCLRND